MMLIMESTSPTELLAWLQRQRLEVLTAITARAALRIFPIIYNNEVGINEQFEKTAIFPAFRNINLSWCVARYGISGKKVAHALRTVDALGVNLDGDINQILAEDVLQTSIVTIRAALEDKNTEIASFQAYNTCRISALINSRTYFDAIFANINVEKEFIDNGGTAALLCDGPIWLSSMPEDMRTKWLSLKNSLLQIGSDWDVWTDWYDDRLSGVPANGALEIAKYTEIAEDAWESGPRVVNPLIGELIERYKGTGSGKVDPDEISEPEPQNAVATTFISGGGDLIDVDRAAGQDALLDDEDATDRHREAGRLADDIISSFDPSEPGANAAKELIGDVEGYRDVLGDTPRDARPSPVITRGEILRNWLKSQSEKDDLSDLPPLSDRYLAKLRNLVAAHNLYAGLDPELARRDEAILGPDARQNLVSPQEGREVVADAVERGAATDAVGEIVAEEAGAAPSVPDPDDRRSRRLSESVKNFARVALGKALTFAKVAAVTGTSAVVGGYAVGQWALANEASLLKMFANNPAMIEVIQKILAVLKTLPLA